jgi:hypothetical protein
MLRQEEGEWWVTKIGASLSKMHPAFQNALSFLLTILAELIVSLCKWFAL